MAKKNEIVSWEAKEYIPREKNTGWYVGLVIVCLALVALSIFLNSCFFYSFSYYHIRPPKTFVNYIITNYLYNITKLTKKLFFSLKLILS